MSTAIGILIVVSAFAVKYSGSMYSGAGWLWSKVSAIRLPSLPRGSTTQQVPNAPTAGEAFAGLGVVVSFLSNATNDPMRGIVKAALDKAQQEAK